MSLIFGILLTLLVLLIVVMIHEFGHFITARMTGMQVEEFGFGIPPRAKKVYTDTQGTEYTINWLPIGGFVRIFGENPLEVTSHDKNTFISKALPSRILVLVAGVCMNFFLAWIIFTTLFFVGIKPLAMMPMPETRALLTPGYHDALSRGYLTYDGILLTALSGGVAERAGIGSGAVLLSIEGRTVSSMDDFIRSAKTNQPFQVTISENGIQKTLILTPENGKVGVYMAYKNSRINENYRIKYDTLVGAMGAGASEVYWGSRMTLNFLGSMMVGLFAPANDLEKQQAEDMLSGPIGMGAFFVTAVEKHLPISMIAIITALISINLGVVNILPLPALDGGRVVTTTLYSLVSFFPRAKKRFTKIEGWFHTLGFVLFLILMLYVAGLDVLRFF